MIRPDRALIVSALDMRPAATAALALIGKLLLAPRIVMAALAPLDYLYQRLRFMACHRMTRQELKDEFEQSEGAPQIRAKIRQLRHEAISVRVMAAVPRATAVIANSMHYAVALGHESGKMAAPVCVAKSVDDVALRIRQVAEEDVVLVVENPPLARALHVAVEHDDVIPPEHYKAVAQSIGYVMWLAKQRAYWQK